MSREERVRELAKLITAILISSPEFTIAYAVLDAGVDINLLPDALNLSRDKYIESQMGNKGSEVVN